VSAPRDWNAWHEEYAEAGSPLRARLVAVQQAIRDILDDPSVTRVVSACAGDGRDLIGVLQDHPRRDLVGALLVELDPELSARSGESGLPGIVALQGDAGDLSAYRGGHEADLLLLCGIFGNIPDAEVEHTIREASRLTSPGAQAIWTRHRRAPDRTPDIRQWWGDAGWEETAFVSAGPDSWSVGVVRLTATPLPYVDEGRLFAFSQ
jgi:hypothetical protein